MAILSKEIKNKLPFISAVKYGEDEYIGIISNQDQNITLMYVYTLMASVELKQAFLELGRIWWDESNRIIPIDIFLRGEMERFSQYMLTMNSKDVTVIDGPCTNLDTLTARKGKRKIIKFNTSSQ